MIFQTLYDNMSENTEAIIIVFVIFCHQYFDRSNGNFILPHQFYDRSYGTYKMYDIVVQFW